MQEKGKENRPVPRHHVYVLRCWQELDGTWRYTVEAADGRALPRRGFAARQALLAHLRDVLPQESSVDFLE